MFRSCKYRDWYYVIIERGLKVKPKEGYYERHHIIPKSMGGENKKKNLVYLTAREHFLVHWLLTRMMETKNHQIKMGFAFSKMRWSTGGERILTSVQYAAAMRANSRATLLRSEDPEFKIRHAETWRKKNLDPIFVAQRAEQLRRLHADPIYVAKMSVHMKHLHADPAFVAKITKVINEKNADPEFRARNIEATKKRNADPEFKAKRSQQMKKQNEDPEFRAAGVRATRRKFQENPNFYDVRNEAHRKKYQEDLEFRTRHSKEKSDLMKRLHSDPEFRVKMIKSNSERMKNLSVEQRAIVSERVKKYHAEHPGFNRPR